MSHIKLIGGNLLVLMFLLLCLEIFFRIIGLGYGSCPMNKDHTFHHIPPKNYKYTAYDAINEEYGGHEVYLDENGRRSKRFAEVRDSYNYSVAFFGDSFTSGLEVPYDKSFVGQLRLQYPNINLINYGTTSYSPVLYYLQAKYLVSKEIPTPKKAFILLYSNDIRDDLSYLGQGKFDSQNELIAIDDGKVNWLIPILRNSYLARYIRRMQLKVKYNLNPPPTQIIQSKVIEGYFEENPDFEQSVSAIYTLKAIKLLEEKGVETYLSVVPSKYANFTKDYDFIELAEKVEQWAAQREVKFINLHTTFEKETLTTNDKFFFKVDAHFNEKGHALTAKILAPYLME